MAIDNATYGAGAGFLSGLVTSILYAFGIKERVSVLEKAKLDEKVFREFKDGLHERLDRIESEVKEQLRKTDRIYDKLVNGV